MKNLVTKQCPIFMGIAFAIALLAHMAGTLEAATIIRLRTTAVTGTAQNRTVTASIPGQGYSTLLVSNPSLLNLTFQVKSNVSESSSGARDCADMLFYVTAQDQRVQRISAGYKGTMKISIDKFAATMCDGGKITGNKYIDAYFEYSDSGAGFISFTVPATAAKIPAITYVVKLGKI